MPIKNYQFYFLYLLNDLVPLIEHVYIKMFHHIFLEQIYQNYDKQSSKQTLSFSFLSVRGTFYQPQKGRILTKTVNNLNFSVHKFEIVYRYSENGTFLLSLPKVKRYGKIIFLHNIKLLLQYDEIFQKIGPFCSQKKVNAFHRKVSHSRIENGPQ